MTIQGLYRYLVERNLFATEKLQHLKKCRIGIDGYMWLKVIQGNPSNIDPYQIGIGGLHLCFDLILKRELKKFKDFDITPVFVFHGIDCSTKWTTPKAKGKKFKTMGMALNRRMESWSKYNRGEYELCRGDFFEYSSRQLFSMSLLHCVFKYFDEHNIEYFVAPYLSWAQLNYFLQQQMIHAVFGGNELLLFPYVRQLITKIQFDEGTYQFIDKDEVLQRVGIDEDTFFDACILSGCFLSDTFEAVAHFSHKGDDPNLHISDNPFDHSIEMCNQIGGGYRVIQMLAQPNSYGGRRNMDWDPKNHYYFQHFHQVKQLILNHVVFTVNGESKPLSEIKECPRNFNNLIGTRLRSDAYFLIGFGILKPKLISILERREYYEIIPLVDSIEYSKTLLDLERIRQLAYNLLNYCLPSLEITSPNEPQAPRKDGKEHLVGGYNQQQMRSAGPRYGQKQVGSFYENKNRAYDPCRKYDSVKKMNLFEETHNVVIPENLKKQLVQQQLMLSSAKKQREDEEKKRKQQNKVVEEEEEEEGEDVKPSDVKVQKTKVEVEEGEKSKDGEEAEESEGKSSPPSSTVPTTSSPDRSKASTPVLDGKAIRVEDKVLHQPNPQKRQKEEETQLRASVYQEQRELNFESQSIVHYILKKELKVNNRNKKICIPANPSELRFMILFKFLELTKYIESRGHGLAGGKHGNAGKQQGGKQQGRTEKKKKLTKTGEVLRNILPSRRDELSLRYLEQYYIIIQLYYDRQILTTPFRLILDTRYSNPRNYCYPRPPKHMYTLLITRMMSLFPVDFIDFRNWNFEIYQDLSAFMSIVHAYYEAYYNLVVTLFCTFFMTRKCVNIPPGEFKNVVNYLPFCAENNCAMGIVFYDILEGKMSLDDVVDKYDEVILNVEHQIFNALKYWSKVKEIIQKLPVDENYYRPHASPENNKSRRWEHGLSEDHELPEEIKYKMDDTIQSTFMKADKFLREIPMIKDNKFFDNKCEFSTLEYLKGKAERIAKRRALKKKANIMKKQTEIAAEIKPPSIQQRRHTGPHRGNQHQGGRFGGQSGNNNVIPPGRIQGSQQPFHHHHQQQPKRND